jgi:hypothetical protein
MNQIKGKKIHFQIASDKAITIDLKALNRLSGRLGYMSVEK